MGTFQQGGVAFSFDERPSQTMQSNALHCQGDEDGVITPISTSPSEVTH